MLRKFENTCKNPQNYIEIKCYFVYADIYMKINIQNLSDKLPL